MLDLRQSNIRQMVDDLCDFGSLLVGLFIYLAIVFVPWALLIGAGMLVAEIVRHAL